MLDAYDGESLAGVLPMELVPVNRRRGRVALRQGSQTYLAIGLNIVAASKNSRLFPFADRALEVNVNTRTDWRYADRMAGVYEPAAETTATR